MSEEKFKNNSLNKKDILQKALDAGFDFNIKDNKGNLPLDYAYSNKDNEIINILIINYNKNSLRIPKNNENC